MAAVTSTLINLVENKELVLNYLQSKNFISEIKSKCHYYKQNSSSENSCLPLFFVLKIEFQEIFNKKLIELITTQTLNFLNILNEVIQSLTNSYLKNLDPNLCVEAQQIHCNLLIHDLPQPEYQFSLCSTHINASLSTFTCVVSSTRPIEKYIRQSTWKCSQCFSAPLKIVRERKVTHKAPKCSRCLKECIELLANRVTSNVCSAQVYEANLLKNCKHYSSTSTLEIQLFDDLCQELKIGQEYIVVGLFDVFSRFYNVFSISLV